MDYDDGGGAGARRRWARAISFLTFPIDCCLLGKTEEEAGAPLRDRIIIYETEIAAFFVRSTFGFALYIFNGILVPYSALLLCVVVVYFSQSSAVNRANA